MTFCIEDELTWRVTTEHPARGLEGMDWERCAALHNLIIRLGWTGRGNSETELPEITWWQAKITTEVLEEKWTQRLSPSLKLFLQTALDQPHDQNFFYYASGLSWPQYLVNPLFEEDSHLCLYQMTNLSFSGHKDGLKYYRKLRTPERRGLTSF